MSLLNEALRKKNLTVRPGLPVVVPAAKTFKLKKPLYIGTAVVITAAILFWSLSTRQADVPIPMAASTTPDQKNTIVKDSSPLTDTGKVNEVTPQAQTEQETTTLSENKTPSIPAKSAFENIASRGPAANSQASQKASPASNENNIKAMTPGSSTKASGASEKTAQAAKVKTVASEGKNTSSPDIQQEDQGNLADKFYQKALQFHRAGRMEEAINMYREVLKLSPDNSGASYNLSSAFIEASKYSEAYDMLSSLLASNPESPEIKLNLAVAEIGLARPAEAIDLLNSVSTDDKKLRFSKFFHLGVATSHSGNLEDALAFYKKAEEINTGYPKLLYNVALTNDKLGNYNDAAAYYKKLLATGSISQDETEAIKARISTLQDYRN
jgi:tetratricopeptide (TPR) repeat protein